MTTGDSFTVRGGRPLRGRARLPGDKSIAHRGLLLGALAQGKTRLANVPDGEDVAATRRCLEALGVGMREDGETSIVITGRGAEGLREPDSVLECANSGTSMRLLAGLLAGRPFHAILAGDASLSMRPMGRVVEPLRAMGARIDGRDDGERAPLAIRGGELRGIEHELSVASAQVKTALVLAGLQAEGRTVVHEPHMSRDHTERLLTALGAPIETMGTTTVSVRAGEPEPFELEVPGDPSSAAYFVVGACIVAGSRLVLEDVSLNPTRVGFVEVLRRMGAHIEVVESGTRLGEPVGELRVEAAALTGTTIEGEEIPKVIDELPVLAVAAAAADGVTAVRDAAELRVKESDRIAALEQELSELGVPVETSEGGFVVTGGHVPSATVLKSHGDHRIAMSGAVAALVSDAETTIRGWRSVRASYPGFGTDLDRLRTNG